MHLSAMESPIENCQEIDADEVHLLESIGKGSFGVVYKALWRGLMVAVKKVETESEVNEFYNEVQQLARVQHENIIHLYGACTSGICKCLVIEYADGGSLYHLLHNSPNTKYNLAHGISWLFQCAKAVAYLHSIQPRPLLHRDLKPPNLLLTKGAKVLKVCDFGTACELSTFMSDNRGSAAWMAPEVFEGKIYTEKCDVYSWGIILWEVVTRRVPFEDLGLAVRIMWAVHQRVRPPLITGCPKLLENLMKRCWDHNQDRRPRMEEVVEKMCLVSRFLKGADEPISNPPSDDSITDSYRSACVGGSSAGHTSRDVSELSCSTGDLPHPPQPSSGSSSTTSTHNHLSPHPYPSPHPHTHPNPNPHPHGNLYLPHPHHLSHHPLPLHHHPLHYQQHHLHQHHHHNNNAGFHPPHDEDSLWLSSGSEGTYPPGDPNSRGPSPRLTPAISPNVSSTVVVSGGPEGSPWSSVGSLDPADPCLQPLAISIPGPPPPTRSDITLVSPYQCPPGHPSSNSLCPHSLASSSSSPCLCPLTVATTLSPGLHTSLSTPLLPTIASPSSPISPPCPPTIALSPIPGSIGSVSPTGVPLRRHLSPGDTIDRGAAQIRRRSAEVSPQPQPPKNSPGHTPLGHRRSSSYGSVVVKEAGEEGQGGGGDGGGGGRGGSGSNSGKVGGGGGGNRGGQSAPPYPSLVPSFPKVSSSSSSPSSPSSHYPHLFPHLLPGIPQQQQHHHPAHLHHHHNNPQHHHNQHHCYQMPLYQIDPGIRDPGGSLGRVEGALKYPDMPPLLPPTPSPSPSSATTTASITTSTAAATTSTTSNNTTTTTTTTAIPSWLPYPLFGPEPGGGGSHNGEGGGIADFGGGEGGVRGGGGGGRRGGGRGPDEDELGAFWEWLDAEEIRPVKPLPSCPESQKIFNEHKEMARKYLVLQQEIFNLRQRKTTLEEKLSQAEKLERIGNQRYQSKIQELESKRESLRHNHSRLRQQLEQIRARQEEQRQRQQQEEEEDGDGEPTLDLSLTPP
ncbi:probable serine/threonine-protein kinase nek3 isoform X2 [Eriocheir sinensis]|uniref:probable serine/threonine-protein kinase nek3 isoform X2 n=1 Tax=Eriocheir sinensis TaxID=95602 RepID=UPI0021C583ED|nr:probable serine/threonine-protein kinase nek3 isoform X2 [Eriocheir sinensis]